MDSYFKPGTSAIDWCEPNYVHSPYIAEFVNVTSNFIFLLLAVILMILSKEYARKIDSGIYVVWALFAIVGLSSAYFHAFLSLFGQLLDEISIAWVLAFSYAMWFPSKYFPSFIAGNRFKFKLIVVSITVATTFLAFIYPWINSIVLMVFGFQTIWLVASEMIKQTDKRVKKLGLYCCIGWTFAVICWSVDRMFCETLLKYDAIYFHGFWHEFVAFASYAAVVFMAITHAKEEYPHLQVSLSYWPGNRFAAFGIAYIKVKELEKRRKSV